MTTESMLKLKVDDRVSVQCGPVFMAARVLEVFEDAVEILLTDGRTWVIGTDNAHLLKRGH